MPRMPISSFPLNSVARFENARVVHSDGAIEVMCREFCFFADGEWRKNWTCDEALPQGCDGCACPSKLRTNKVNDRT